MNAKSTVITVGIVAVAAAIVFVLLQQNPSEQTEQKAASTQQPAGAGAVVELKVELDTVVQKASYGLGYQMAQNIKETNSDLDADAIALAIKDVLTGESRMTRPQIRQAMRSYMDEKVAARNALGEKFKSEGMAFLAENKKKDDIQVTDSGLQYKVLKKGDGEKPKGTDMVSVNYKGTFLDGKVFDSSYDRGVPATFKVDGVIDGWTEGLQLMPVGSKYKFFIPAELAYGEKGMGEIPPHAVLAFEVELLEIKDEEQAKKDASVHAHGQQTAKNDTVENKTESTKKD